MYNQQPQGKSTRYEESKTFPNRCEHRGIKPNGENKESEALATRQGYFDAQRSFRTL